MGRGPGVWAAAAGWAATPGLLALAVTLIAAGPFAAADPATPPPDTTPLYRPVAHPGIPGYLVHLPEGYEDPSASFPLLFFLHGIVQKGDGSTGALERVADHGPFRTMRDGAWDRSLPLIVVGPQSTGLQPWWRGGAVRSVLEHVRATYRVDHRRVYLSGISMGGRGVWWLAKNFSNEFAAVVPVSAWAGDLSRSCDVFRGMGIWAFHGDRDPLIRLASGRQPIETLGACSPPLAPSPLLTVLTDAGHGQWGRVYGPSVLETSAGDDGNKGADATGHRDIYRWMLTFSR